MVGDGLRHECVIFRRRFELLAVRKGGAAQWVGE
jgi:hypothetical protein